MLLQCGLTVMPGINGVKAYANNQFDSTWKHYVVDSIIKQMVKEVIAAL